MLPARVSSHTPSLIYTKYNITLIYTTFIPLPPLPHTKYTFIFQPIYTTTPNISTHIRSGPIVFPLLYTLSRRRRWRYNDDRACENYMGVRGSEPPPHRLYFCIRILKVQWIVLCCCATDFFLPYTIHMHYRFERILYDCRIVVEKYIFFSRIVCTSIRNSPYARMCLCHQHKRTHMQMIFC